MKNITLKQLRYFEALARHGHFGQAAAASAISQPALSVQIKELERELGLPLFERSARRVALTGFGADFALRVRDILRAVDELGELAQASGDQMAGRLRIGVIPTIAPYLLPRLIGALTLSHPGLEVNIRETLTSRLLEELHSGRLDTAILALPVSEPGLQEASLFSEEFLLVRPQSDADNPVPGPAALSEMRLLLLEEGHCFRDQALSFCATRSAIGSDGLDGSTLSTLVQMVGAGIGVTLIPEMALPVETRSATVSTARFSGTPPSRRIGMVWRKTTPLADKLENIAQVVAEVGESLISEARTQPAMARHQA
ncbi:hydrogen peroxide-inducible genes activator [Thalassococcus lentus]|uniref:LysR substrate-binding domain-containing protein n=1 Tax=Thalassococcus lentus TaxID=1210524 RepID=A0ABT4XXQ3_9RHOB|nr:hydrogen peroxide-inducible genes activator [Thalassococcus lentus]MDA7426723.1 LysR substrate-binding domain-containing protein [Thalassococcus lentus]